MWTEPFSALMTAEEESFAAFVVETQNAIATHRAGRSVLYAAGILLPIGYANEATMDFIAFELE